MNFERMAELQKDLAFHVRNYFDLLKQNGFTDEQALVLTAAWQDAMTGSKKPNNGV
jgi:hypothetical protein